MRRAGRKKRMMHEKGGKRKTKVGRQRGKKKEGEKDGRKKWEKERRGREGTDLNKRRTACGKVWKLLFLLI